jgi:competence protein ComEC
VTVLHPPRTEPPEAFSGDRAKAPLWLRVEWGLFAAVLAGGTGPGPGEAVLHARPPLGATFLKVGGHGSRRASPPGLLTAVDPRFAAIPIGARTAFGRPVPEALADLATAGATVYRTDLDGAIDVRSDGTRAWVRAWGRPGPPAEFPLRGSP